MVRKEDGFTLIEVLIAMSIVGILAAIAIPLYGNTLEQSRGNEAKAILSTIYTAEKIYRVNNAVFWNGGASPPIDTINSTLSTDIDPPQYYNISSITATAGTTFTAFATRISGTTTYYVYYGVGGKTDGVVYTPS